MFDIVLAGTSFVVLSPLFTAIALVVWWKDGNPILFRHTRVGLKGRLFRLYKFRTMIPDAASNGPAITVADGSAVSPEPAARCGATSWTSCPNSGMSSSGTWAWWVHARKRRVSSTLTTLAG